WLAWSSLLTQNAWAESITRNANTQASHKLQITDPRLAGPIIAQGGRQLADYGSSQLYEIAQVPSNMAASSAVIQRDKYNLVFLNALVLDTSKDQVKALRKAVGSFEGKRLHLVHFVGPILPAWHESLIKCGVQVVA